MMYIHDILTPEKPVIVRDGLDIYVFLSWPSDIDQGYNIFEQLMVYISDSSVIKQYKSVYIFDSSVI
jgi:hypothetical protein